MRVAERHREPVEAHFTEGEPDLEPPEELAIGELGEDAILEEDLDNEDVLEQDVDEDVLEVTLEDLAHADTDDDDLEPSSLDADGAAPASPVAASSTVAPGPDDDLDDDDVDVEQALDRVLFDRLALADGGGTDDEESAEARGVAVLTRPDTLDLVEVAPCGPAEFVCRACFLVRNRALLVDPDALLCRDCGG